MAASAAADKNKCGWAVHFSTAHPHFFTERYICTTLTINLFVG